MMVIPTRFVTVAGVEMELPKPALLKHIKSYCVRRVVSPFEFYMEEELDQNMIDIDTRELQLMQPFYAKQDLQFIEYDIRVTKWKCYVYQDPLTEVWCRVRVHNFVKKGRSKRALVYFCDYGRQEVVPCESLRRLNGRFKVLGTPLLRCYLYDVLPIRGGFYWPMDAVMYFKEMVNKKFLNAIVMNVSESTVVHNFPDLKLNCGVVLMSKAYKVGETINWTMVKRGYAQSIGIMATSPEMLYLPEKIPHFDGANNYSGAAVLSPNSPIDVPLEELHQITVRAMASNADIYRDSSDMQRPPPPRENPGNYLSKTLRDRLAWIKLSFVEGPSKMFVHMKRKYDELKKMNEELQMEARDLPPPELIPGALVACEIEEEDKEDSEGEKECCKCYCRGVIKSGPSSQSGTTDTTVEVILVDYGCVIRVPVINIHRLPEMFRSMPSFVLRVHLRNVRPKVSSNWHRNTERMLYKYLLSYELAQPLYYACWPESQDKIVLTDIEQPICFNEELNTWVASSVKPPEENECINSMKDDPLLASHFCSYAVNIQYEMLVEEHEFWSFEDISDFLIKRENGVPTKPEVSKNQIHEIITNGFGTI
ncbi:RING finger protein 17 [Orchesella cincta]|uniref:RING finger protein 17 n=1 Tax=Orchesella cincta TaxID=48709 RepID=A0A1D2MWK8_ORCCI|nr:RING finger protein 17 [Orchesella cincta]